MDLAQLIIRESTQEERDAEEHRDNLRPEKSLILAQIVVGGSHLFQKWDPNTKTWGYLDLEFYEFQYKGGSAAIEDDAGMLQDAVAPMMEDFWHPGWVIVEDFYGHYSKDYWGEVDCDYEFDNVRPARWSDYERMIGRRPWWARSDRYIPRLFGHPGTIWEKIGIWLSTPVSRVGEYDPVTI